MAKSAFVSATLPSHAAHAIEERLFRKRYNDSWIVAIGSEDVTLPGILLAVDGHRRRAAAWDIPPALGRREMRHDLELGQRRRVAVLNSRHLSRVVVDLHPGVRLSHNLARKERSAARVVVSH